MQQIFDIGQIVCLRAEPTRSGPVIEILPVVGGRARYRIFHSPTNIQEYHEDQLINAESTSKPTNLSEKLAAEQLLDVPLFQARLTAARLSHPQIDNLYSLKSARIKFIPFQFKPLLRFLRAEQPRLLIADEVGVGKTIESGLILRELQTRQQLENILIVCPKALVNKWRAEMRRFDEDFRVLTSKELSYCLRETDLNDGVWPSEYSRAIVHIELLRIDKYSQGMKGRSPNPGFFTLKPSPHFSLMIVDEAHHLRNAGTSSHEIVKFLCEITEAVIFLSATPLHLGNRNLYTLLNLLRPDLFIDVTVFNEMMEPNQYINQAIRHVRNRAPKDTWQNLVFQALQNARTTKWGEQVLRQDPRFADWYQKFKNRVTLTDLERINCLRDLEEVHSLAHIMNRTRRRDIGRFTIREPYVISVPFSPEQKEFYQALIEFRREILSLYYEENVIRLIIDTLERQAASCLPALIPTLNEFIQTGKFTPFHISDDIEFEDEDSALSTNLLDKAENLRSLSASLSSSEDPKLAKLIQIIEEALKGNGSGKVLIFSYFLHTLSYLQKHLHEAGYRVEVINGKINDDIREHLRDRFRLPSKNKNSLDILLSSEVGCEGLDYEFCDRLVNYDIPWNPMRIEQRIGRIDRMGQKSEKVLIYNFVTPGTVEDRIFYRCFDRLGIFQDTIGDLEEVLGDVLNDLNRLALDSTLSPEQAEQQAQQMADNALRLVEEQRRLEAEGSAFLGIDEASFTADVNSIVNEDKFVSDNDLRQMIEIFLEQPNLGGQILDSGQPGVHHLRLNKDGRKELLSKMQGLKESNRNKVGLKRWLENNESFWQFTFNQETALEKKDISFVTPVHPLARVAISHWGEMDEPLVTQVAISTNEVPSGRYLFVCDLWESLGVRKEVRLVGNAYDLDKQYFVPEVSNALVPLLSQGTQPAEYLSFPASIIDPAIHQLDETLHEHRLNEVSKLRERNNSLLNRQLASLDAYYQNRLERVINELDLAREERIKRMKESEQSRIIRDYENKKAELEDRREADIISQRIATGILLIEEVITNG